MLSVLITQGSHNQPSTMKTKITLFTTIRFLIRKPVEQKKLGFSLFGHMRHQLQLDTNGKKPAATFTH